MRIVRIHFGDTRLNSIPCTGSEQTSMLQGQFEASSHFWKGQYVLPGGGFGGEGGGGEGAAEPGVGGALKTYTLPVFIPLSSSWNAPIKAVSP